MPSFVNASYLPLIAVFKNGFTNLYVYILILAASN